MSRHLIVPLAAALVLAACSDKAVPTATLTELPEAGNEGPTNARERLAARLAVALAQPDLRAELRERFASSRSPEGKLQFQALANADNRQLIGRLATAGNSSVTELLADLDAARRLELYLPVPSHRESWDGGIDLLVATAETDEDRPVAFNPSGERFELSALSPPSTPVIALVPQEHDFTGGRPSLRMSCIDDCDSNIDGGSGGGTTPAPSDPKGLYLRETHFDSDHESWLKGSPEFEFHVYGEINGESQQLSCTGEHANSSYRWDTDNLDWIGTAALLTEQDINQYISQNSMGIIRIVAWEDDQVMCEPRYDSASMADLLKKLDTAYKGLTAIKLTPGLFGTLERAHAGWDLVNTIFGWLNSNDDLIGYGIEASISDWLPGNSNYLLKGQNTVTNGSFGVTYNN